MVTWKAHYSHHSKDFFFKLEKWQVDNFYWTHGRTEDNQLEWNPRRNKCPQGETRSEHWPTQLDCGKISVGTLKRPVRQKVWSPRGDFFSLQITRLGRVLEEAPLLIQAQGKWASATTGGTLPPPQMFLPSPYCGSKALICRVKGSDTIAIGGIISGCTTYKQSEDE